MKYVLDIVHKVEVLNSHDFESANDLEAIGVVLSWLLNNPPPVDLPEAGGSLRLKQGNRVVASLMPSLRSVTPAYRASFDLAVAQILQGAKA